MTAPKSGGDVDAAIGEEPRQLCARVRAVSGAAPARDLARIAVRKVKMAEVDQEAQVLDVGLPYSR